MDQRSAATSNARTEVGGIPPRVPRRTSHRRWLTAVGSVVLSLGVLLGTAQPAAAADFTTSHVPSRTYAWTLTQSYSGSCYLNNGVRWTFTARWNFGYTARTSVRVNSVQVSYRATEGGTAGGAFLSDSAGRGVWESSLNFRTLPRGTAFTQTFAVGGRVATQGPNGIRFRVQVRPGACAGTTVFATFDVRST